MKRACDLVAHNACFAVGSVCDVMFINPDSTKILYVYQNYVENVFKCVEETLHNGGAGIIHRETQRGERINQLLMSIA